MSAGTVEFTFPGASPRGIAFSADISIEPVDLAHGFREESVTITTLRAQLTEGWVDLTTLMEDLGEIRFFEELAHAAYLRSQG